MNKNIQIEIFENSKKQCAFVNPYVTKHFVWDDILPKLINEESFPHIIMAMHQDSPLGMILLHTNITYEIDTRGIAPEGSIWMYRLYVDEAYRKQGIGQQLVRSAENYVREQGYNEIWLDTVQAADYYQKLGYDYVCAVPYQEQYTKVYKKNL